MSTVARPLTTIGPFELYEALIIIFLLVGLVPMTLRFWRCRYRWFYVGYLAFFVGILGSVLQLPRLEHGVGIGLASFLFWWTTVKGATDMEAWALEDYQDIAMASDDDDAEEEDE